MRCGLFVAAAVAAVSAVALTTTGARADDEYCGYTLHANALIQCGYSSLTECENAMGKGGMCFVDPEYALNERRFTPAIVAKLPG